ncbi:hypothetical protein BN6_01830 [Saccharothrix espanaensis DSM 44229]|uniref:Uncharacterized protein n=1 Tax=Saccharothrix espanaensis (strain ATCC 51144 / DSM 44229 / JCM 9112 / NBRC 15066 / NRRL 15764) TaxID=1179773 RepID=K0JPW9_SACES|nr:hypothetical protein BN6_01830 [Saccharothrix espanaensis DSM 44229]
MDRRDLDAHRHRAQQAGRCFGKVVGRSRSKLRKETTYSDAGIPVSADN